MTQTLLRIANPRILNQFREKGAKFSEFPTSNTANDDEGLRMNFAFASRSSLRRWNATPGSLLKITTNRQQTSTTSATTNDQQQQQQYMVVQVWHEESYWTMTKTATSDPNSVLPELFVSDVDANRANITLDTQVRLFLFQSAFAHLLI